MFVKITHSRIFLGIALLVINFIIGCEQSPKKVPSEITVSGLITEDTQWNAQTTYILDQKVIVAKGVTLTIEAGTIVKAMAGEASQVSMLVIARGAKINAAGTEDQPIIFTSINDNIDPKKGTQSVLNIADRGLWGGIIILGDAPVSLQNQDDETFYVGLNPNSAESYYGGENVDDNSGVMEYVSIRHGGVFIGTGNESNGLTLCGVGANTKINHIEIYANLDDGVEFFGGTVNVNNLIVHGSGDDGIDIDQGYSGSITNFLIELEEISDSALEISGGKGDFTGNFNLSNGVIDGKNSDKQLIYSIDENAKGKIKNLIEVNVKDDANRVNNASKVSIETAQADEELNAKFNWSKAKS